MNRLRGREIFRNEHYTVSVIERSEILAGRSGMGNGLFVQLTPECLLIRDAQGVNAFDMSANPVTAEWLQSLEADIELDSE